MKGKTTALLYFQREHMFPSHLRKLPVFLWVQVCAGSISKLPGYCSVATVTVVISTLFCFLCRMIIGDTEAPGTQQQRKGF